MDDQLQFGGKRVAVTGAASGIGEATAALLGELGAEVVGLDIRPPTVALSRAVQFDLRDRRSIEAAAAEIGPPLDGIYNCAGLPQTAPGLDVLLAGFVGARELTERLLTHMRPGGAILCVASTAAYPWVSRLPSLDGLIASPSFEVAVEWCREHLGSDADNYALAKGAMMAYTARRGFELAPQGVRINCVAPGPTATPMTSRFTEQEPDYMRRLPLPMGRMASAREQAWVLAFLGSPRASFVSGSTVFVDGGYMGALTMGLVTR